jgi:hypothetical protein
MERVESLEHTDRIMAECDEIAERPVLVDAAGAFDVGEHGVERDRIAVDVRDHCHPHAGRP